MTIEILSMWKPGMQADAHEVLIGMLNSAGILSSIIDLIQFEIVTTGMIKCSVNDSYIQ